MQANQDIRTREYQGAWGEHWPPPPGSFPEAGGKENLSFSLVYSGCRPGSVHKCDQDWECTLGQFCFSGHKSMTGSLVPILCRKNPIVLGA